MTYENSWQSSGLDTIWINRSSHLLTATTLFVSHVKTAATHKGLCSRPGDWGTLTAFKAEFEDHINVYFPPQESLQYKFHCIYHELGHIYLESLDLAQPGIPQAILRETKNAINVSCRHIEDHPVERWVEAFAFRMSKKTRERCSSTLDPFLC